VADHQLRLAKLPQAAVLVDTMTVALAEAATPVVQAKALMTWELTLHLVAAVAAMAL
jgi:hypothetical protein